MDINMMITPLFNENQEFIRNMTTDMSTGSRDINEVCNIKQTNGASHINKQQNIYDGNGY